jgi:ADP-ribosylglycohydrolase
MRGDADTVGAITGQLAGAIYGLGETPERWRQAVTRYGNGTRLLFVFSSKWHTL